MSDKLLMFSYRNYSSIFNSYDKDLVWPEVHKCNQLYRASGHATKDIKIHYWAPTLTTLLHVSALFMFFVCSGWWLSWEGNGGIEEGREEGWRDGEFKKEINSLLSCTSSPFELESDGADQIECLSKDLGSAGTCDKSSHMYLNILQKLSPSIVLLDMFWSDPELDCWSWGPFDGLGSGELLLSGENEREREREHV